MSVNGRGTHVNERWLDTFFLSVSAASFTVIVVYGFFFAGYLLTDQALMDRLFAAVWQRDFITVQEIVEQIDEGVMSVEGWVRLALGLALLLVSFLFMLNIGGTIYSVFVHRPFKVGDDKATRSYLRQALSRLYLTLKLTLFIALYKATGLRGLTIVQEFFPGSPLLKVPFFLSNVLNLSTLIILASIIKVVVYEVRRYEDMVEHNRLDILAAIDEFLRRWKNSSIVLEEGLLSDEAGYIKAKLEDATRDMRQNLRLLEAARGDLNELATPSPIIRKLVLTFVGVVILQFFTDFILYVGWGTVLSFVIGVLSGSFDWTVI